MIDHLTIRNFLAFPELEVPELKLINLVAGKNNTGKTAMLEALQLLRSPHKALVLGQIIQQRSSTKSAFSILHQNGKLLSSLSSQINDLNIEIGSEAYDSRFLDENGQAIGRPEPEDLITTQYAAITSKTNDHDWIALAWNSLVLTPNEDVIVSILGDITGIDIARIAVTDTSVKIKIHKIDKPVDIKSLGDGMMRLLQIIITMVKIRPIADNLFSLFLIDEIETHLHHSVIRKLWKIIFEYAIKWNIQVVATTHSQDAIREFWYEAAESEEYQKIGQVLRLQVGREGKHEVIQFPFERLDSVMEMEMEIR